MIINRRSFLVGLLAAPIIVRPGIIMPVRPLNSWINENERWYFYDVGLPPDATVVVVMTRNSVEEIRRITGVPGNFSAVNMRRES